ncbi:Pre-mRNA-splicing factor slt11 [Elasticomyces elasticus]|nr:Pre-mRNA-splicing factor slt11 [Elasticomyces elasticus]
MPPQIKHDLNRSGWETSDMPSVCERCLPDNPYVQMLKEDHGAECKICTRPFTIFRWKADRTARQKRTMICLTCARLKNCCQHCMLDLSFGLPIVVRDAALKMIAPGPQSEVNREYYAQEHEKEIEEGRGAVEAYEKTDEKARDLLRRLAQSEPYYKKQRRMELEGGGDRQNLLENGAGGGGGEMVNHTPGPIRTSDSRPKQSYGPGPSSRGAGTGRGGRGGARGGRAFPSTATLPLQPHDILPPADPNVTSLFITGVEDDLPENDLRTHFSQFGVLRSVVCSHRSHCAFMNYMTREGAEAAAAACQGKAIVKGVPLRVQWGRPKPLDNLDRDVRMAHARAGRETVAAQKAGTGSRALAGAGAGSSVVAAEYLDDFGVAAAPPGQDDVQYASLAGE